MIYHYYMAAWAAWRISVASVMIFCSLVPSAHLPTSTFASTVSISPTAFSSRFFVYGTIISLSFSMFSW